MKKKGKSKAIKPFEDKLENINQHSEQKKIRSKADTERMDEEILAMLEDKAKQNNEDINEVGEDYSPFSEKIIELPIIEEKYYLEELVDWIMKSSEHKGKDIFLIEEDDQKEDIDYKQISEIVFPATPEDYTIESWTDPLIEKDFLNLEQNRLGFKENNSEEHFNVLKLILNAVKLNPEEFILLFAKRNSFSKLIGDDYSGEIKCLYILMEKIQTCITNQDKRLIPELNYVEPYFTLFSHNLTKLPNNTQGKRKQKYIKLYFSKKTSDGFSKALNKIINDRIEALVGITKSIPVNEVKNPAAVYKTRERMKEILKELKVKNALDDNKIGVPSVLLLFNELKKEGIINSDIPKSNLSLAIAILTGYSYDDIANKTTKAESDIQGLFREAKSSIIESKISRLIRSVDKINESLKTIKGRID